MKTKVLALALAVALCFAATADAHTLSMRTARHKAQSALAYEVSGSGYHARVRLADCIRWTRHKTICQGTWEEDTYDEFSPTDYCLATINVRFRSRYSRRLKTWIHSRECF